jgi:hypothetical protein
MAETTKEKILKINTQGAEKNVKSLKTQIRELKEQLAQLEEGTEEYNRVAKQLADTNQKQIEINEAMLYSNSDLGASLSSLTKVAAGVAGAINSVNAVMLLMGADSEEAQKALKPIMAMMALIQGLSAIDTAIKALNGLKNAFSGLSKVKGATAASTTLSTGAVVAEATALADNTVKTEANNAESVLYDEAQLKNAETTNTSTTAIIRQTAVMEEAARLQKLFAETSNGHNKTIEGLNKRLAEGSLSFDEYARKIELASESAKNQTLTLNNMSTGLKNNTQAKNQNNTANSTGVASESANTTATNANTAAKTKNTVATNANAKAQKNANVATGASAPALKNATKGVNGLTTAFKGLSKAIPWLLAISVAVGVISSMFGQASEEEEKMKQRLQDYQDMLNNINKTIEEGKVHVDVLLNRLSSNPSLAEKEAIVKELNKEVPNLNAKIDETTKAVTYSEEALNKYNKQLEARTKLKAYESQLADLKAQRAEYDLMMRIAQHSPLKKKEWEEAKKNLTQVENMIKGIELEIGRINLADALNPDKKDSGGGVKTVVRTVKEMLADIKSLYKEVLGDMTKIADTKNLFGDSYDALDSFRNKIYELTAGSIGTKAGKTFTAQFIEGIENGFEGLDLYNLTVDQVFNREGVDALVQQLVEEEQLLAKYLNKEIKVSETVIKKQKEKVANLTTEVNTIREIIDAVQKLGEEEEKQLKKEKELRKWNRNLEQTKQLYYELRDDTRRNNPFVEVNQSILKAQYSLQNLNDELRELTEEEQRLMAGSQNKQTTDRLEEIAKRRRELALEQFNLENDLDEAQYQERLIRIEELKKEQEKKANERSWQDEYKELYYGNGGDTYNTEYQNISNNLQLIKDQIAAIEDFYKKKMKGLEKTSVEYMLYEAEMAGALVDLEKEKVEQEVALEQEKTKRKLKIAKSYVSAYQTISTQTLNIMGAVMDGMDENTQEYKNMKYAQGVIDTLSGTLAGFMSGVESGLPAPWNLVLAAATAASVFATGMIQLSNIKNEKLANGAQSSANTGSFGEYDTLSYMQQDNILGSIQDSRVYVLESDITSTQNRVQVAESSATF